MPHSLSRQPAPPQPVPPKRGLAVRIAAAQAAVTASKRTGRPVDPRVEQLAQVASNPAGEPTRSRTTRAAIPERGCAQLGD